MTDTHLGYQKKGDSQKESNVVTQSQTDLMSMARTEPVLLPVVVPKTLSRR